MGTVTRQAHRVRMMKKLMEIATRWWAWRWYWKALTALIAVSVLAAPFTSSDEERFSEPETPTTSTAAPLQPTTSPPADDDPASPQELPPVVVTDTTVVLDGSHTDSETWEGEAVVSVTSTNPGLVHLIAHTVIDWWPDSEYGPITTSTVAGENGTATSTVTIPGVTIGSGQSFRVRAAGHGDPDESPDYEAHAQFPEPPAPSTTTTTVPDRSPAWCVHYDAWSAAYQASEDLTRRHGDDLSTWPEGESELWAEKVREYQQAAEAMWEAAPDTVEDWHRAQAVCQEGALEETETASDWVERCWSRWDGNWEQLEDVIRPTLNDPSSMETSQTRYLSSDSVEDGTLTVWLDYSAENAFGGRVQLTAVAEMGQDCEVVEVLFFGWE